MRNSTPHNPSQLYRADIDGLRCIAVLSVLFYHANISGFSGGYVGVDVFFVISGFLITSIILREHLDDRFSLIGFYVRRARRLFPALFIMLSISTLFAFFLLLPRDLDQFGKSLATAAAFTSNFWFWSEAGYFKDPSELMPLLHTWSLAVEEQYYLIFPLLLIGIGKYFARRYIIVVALIFALSLTLSAYFVNRAPDASFFLLPFRFWELLTGSLLAIFLVLRPNFAHITKRLLREIIGLIGLGMVSFSIYMFNDSTPFPGFAALVPCLGTMLMIYAGCGGKSFVRSILSIRPMVFIGLISYSLYLWHWPVLVFMKQYFIRPLNPLETGFAIALSLLLAYLSLRFIEQPFRKPRVMGTNLSIKEKSVTVFAFSSFCVLILFGTGTLLGKLDGIPSRMSESAVEIASYSSSFPKSRRGCFAIPPDEINTDRLCRIGPPNLEPTFMLWGDSHAMMLLPTFERIASSMSITGLEATYHGCQPLLEAVRTWDEDRRCPRYNDAILKVLATEPNIKTIVLVARWAISAEGSFYGNETGAVVRLVDAQSKEISAKENSRVFQRSMQRTVKAITDLGRNVVIVASIPEIGWDTPKVLAKSIWFNRPIIFMPSKIEYESRQQFVSKIMKDLQRENVQILWPAEVLCPGEDCLVVHKGKPVYTDDDHLSSVGAELIEPLLSNAFTSILGPHDISIE